MPEFDRKTSVIEYEYKLTIQDLLDYGTKIANLDEEDDNVECERKSSAAGFKARLDENHTERKRLSRCVRTGIERKVGECEMLYDYDAGIVDFREINSGIVVYSRKITADERQLNLFANEGGVE